MTNDQDKPLTARLLRIRAALIGDGYTQAIGIELNALHDEISDLEQQNAALREQLRVADNHAICLTSLNVEIAAKEIAERERDELRERKDCAYLERNRLVAVVARMALAAGYAVVRTRTAIEGWSEDWHGCVYIVLPCGQASWHYHDSQAFLFADLPTGEMEYDGHTTEQKYERLHEWRPASDKSEIERLRKALEEIDRHATGHCFEDDTRQCFAAIRELIGGPYSDAALRGKTDASTTPETDGRAVDDPYKVNNRRGE